MANSIVTLRPVAHSGAGGTLTVSGAASLQAALSDDWDGSYGQEDSNNLRWLYFPQWQLPPLAQLRSLATRIRWATQNSTYGGYGVPNLRVYIYTSGQWQTINAPLVYQGIGGNQDGQGSNYDTILNLNSATLATRNANDNGAWTQDNLNKLAVGLWGNYPGPSNPIFYMRWYEASLDVGYNMPPSLSVTGPSGIVPSLTPTITFTYSDPEGDAKERHTAKIFKQPAAGWGSLDPETNTADLIYNSGDVVTSALTQAVGTAITRGVTHRAYVKAADVGSGARYGHWWPGPDFKAESSGWGGISR